MAGSDDSDGSGNGIGSGTGDDDLWRLSAVELAAGIRSKQFSSVEVTESVLDRIAARNPKLNAIVFDQADDARRQAADADRAVAAGEPLGPLHGVPVTTKENIDLTGTPNPNGVPAFADTIARRRLAGCSKPTSGRCGVRRQDQHPRVLDAGHDRQPLAGPHLTTRGTTTPHPADRRAVPVRRLQPGSARCITATTSAARCGFRRSPTAW